MNIDTNIEKYHFSLQKSQSLSRWSRVKEVVVVTLVGWIPRPLGTLLRRLIYRTIFARMGQSLHMQAGVELMGAKYIEIGNHVKVLRDVRLNAFALNSKIRLADRVCLDRGVDVNLVAAEGNCHVEIGEWSYLGPYTCIAGPGHIKIGKSCLIASHVGIYANDHNFADPTRLIGEQGVTCQGITIEDDCWLGTGVKVLDGVTIGQGSVIGAGAVVTKNISPYSVAVGVPARVITSRKPSEPMNSTRHQGNQEHICKEDSHFPIPLSAALGELEETTALIYQYLQTANDTASAHLVFENLLHKLLDCIRQVMSVDTIAVLLQTEDRQHLTVRATLGLEEEVAQKIQIPIGRGFAGNIAASCKPIIVNDLMAVEVASLILRQKGIQSMVGVPLLVKGQVIGVFHVGTVRPHQFTKDDTQLLQLVSYRIGLMIDRLRTV